VVTRTRGCGQPWTGRAFEIPIRSMHQGPCVDQGKVICISRPSTNNKQAER
jgi:hypothetical protein